MLKECKIYTVTLLITVMLFSTVSTHAKKNPSSKILIIPKPQEVILKNKEIIINSDWIIMTDISIEGDLFSAKYLKRKILNSFDLSLPIRDISSQIGKKNIIFGTINNDCIKKIIAQKIIIIPDNMSDEGYILQSSSDNIIIIAKGSRGLFYGMQTLLQLFEKKGEHFVLPEACIKDRPDTKLRAVYLCAPAPQKMKCYLEEAAKLKYNAVVVESFDFFNLDEYKKRKIWQDIFKYARQLHIEPIPKMQSFGVGGNVLRKEPHAAEGIYVKNEPFEFRNNIACPVLSSKIKLENSGFEKGTSGWQLGQDWIIDNDSYGDNFSAKITVDGPLSRRSTILKSKRYSLSPNSIYNLSFFAKVNNIGGKNHPALRVVELDSMGDQIKQHNIYIKEKMWTKKELNFKTSSNCAQIYIYCNIWDGYGQAWFDEISLRRLDNALINVIRSSSSDIVITNADKTKTYVEDIDYYFIDGVMIYPYNTINSPTQIERIATGDIGAGETVLVSYDFVARLCTYASWSIPYCPFEDKTYAVMNDAIENVVNLLHPQFISIGHDEIRGLNRDSRCKKRNLTNAEVLAYEINKLYGIIKDLDSEVKILISDDMLNPWHNGGDENYQVQWGGVSGETFLAAELIPKDIIIMIWWYDAKDYLGKMQNSLGYFKKKGFNYLVVAYKNKENIKNWIEIISERNDCSGFVIANWEGFEKNLKNVKFAADSIWSLKNETE